MSLRKNYKTDTTAEVEGVWFEVDFNTALNKPTRFKLARMSGSNKRYTKALEAATKPHMAAIQAETLAEETAKRMLTGVFVEAIALEFEGVSKSDLTEVDTDDGVELASTPENMRALLDKYPDLYAQLEAQSKRLSAYRAKEVDANAKN